MAANIEENITRVVEIDNMEQLIKVSKLPNLIIIDFSATWCGPCQEIKPYFKELSTNNAINDLLYSILLSCRLSALK